VGTGLPNLPRVLTEARSYAERLFAYRRIGALDEAAASEALSRPTEGLGVAWLPGALNRAVSASAGYPFFLQAFGKHIWDRAPGPDAITLDDAVAGAGAAQLELDEGFYGSRWERATPSQRSYLEAMAEEGDDPVATAGVAARLGRPQAAVGPHRDQLIKKGLIYSPRRGTVAFSVPGMGAYIERAAP